MERNERSHGDEVGGYRIVRTLGAGSSGTVYLARDGGGAEVALKVLHRSIAATDEARLRLLREVAALRKVDDDAFVTVLDAEVDADDAFIVTQFVDGPSLEDEVLGGGPLGADEVIELADKLMHALTAVHEAGLVHRDVKPSNILLADHGPVLIDFGISQSETDARATSHGFVMGTPGYLAPEQLDGAAPHAAADWWGWAAAIAFAVTGRAPFGVRPLEAVLGRVRTGDVDLAGVGPLTAQALRGALAADPDQRLAPDDVVGALHEAAQAGESHDHSPTTIPVDRRQSLAGAGATAAAASRAEVPEEIIREGTGPYGAGVAVAPKGAPPVQDGATAVLRVPTGIFGDAEDDGEPGDAPETHEELADWDGVMTGAVPTPAEPRPNPYEMRPALADQGQRGSVETGQSPGAANGTSAADQTSTAALPTRSGDPSVVEAGPGARTHATTVLATSPERGAAPVAATAEDAAADFRGTSGDGFGDTEDDSAGPGAGADGGLPAPGDSVDADGQKSPRLAHPRRPVAIFALAIPVAIAAGLFPVITMIAVLVLLILVRSVGVTREAMDDRFARRGPGKADGLRHSLSYPWYLLKAAVGMIPSVLVAAAIGVMALGTVWWLLQTNRLLIADIGPLPVTAPGEVPAPVRAALGTHNATWVFIAALAAIALTVLVMLWFGPISETTRTGGRTILAAIAPGIGGTLFIIVIAIALCALFALWIAVGKPIEWWPVGGPPNLS